jgi:hypothetical protein
MSPNFWQASPTVGVEPHVTVFDKSTRQDGTFSRDDFTYHHAGDVYYCPGGKMLTTNAAYSTCRCPIMIFSPAHLQQLNQRTTCVATEEFFNKITTNSGNSRPLSEARFAKRFGNNILSCSFATFSASVE